MTNQYVPERRMKAYIKRNYPELVGCEISIGALVNYYRVIVTDPLNVVHTLRIPTSGPGKSMTAKANDKQLPTAAARHGFHPRWLQFWLQSGKNQKASPRLTGLKFFSFLVRRGGLEPPRDCSR